MRKDEIESMLAKGLPDVPHKDSEKQALEYVTLVYQGIDKVEAYKDIFPERYDRVYNKAIKDRRNPRNTLMNHIAMYEQGKYVSSLYNVGAENFFMQFVDMKTRMLYKLNDIFMDDNQKMSHRLNASKIFLGAIPEPVSKVKHEVEVDVNVTFKQKLEERQKMLYAMANPTDIIEADIEYNEI